MALRFIFIDEFIDIALKFIQHCFEIFLTGVNIFVFEIFSREPVSAELAVDLQLSAMIFKMLLNS